MKNKLYFWLKEKLPLSLSTLFVYIILIATICVSCVQIYDRCQFHNQIKKIAIEETKKRCSISKNDTPFSVINPTNEQSRIDTTKIDKRILSSNNTINNSPNSIDCSNDFSLLNIMAKSDGLLSSNGLTFCITLIVSLLATLVVIKIETNEKIIRETIEKEIASEYESTIRFNNILIRIESAYNVTIIIGSITIPMLQNVTNQPILENIANWCSRLSLICSEIDSRLNRRESRLDYLTDYERDILNTYLEDTLGELKRILQIVQKIGSDDLSSIIENIIRAVDNIKDLIDVIEKKG